MAKENFNFEFDVAVVGAGPAGIMAAAEASKGGLKVILIEKNIAPGKKLLLTGNGKCNLTNAEFNLKELVKNYNNGEFLFHAFSVFGPKETIYFFEQLGIKTKTIKDKKVFPVSEDAEEVLESLLKYLKKNKVKTILNSEIVDVVKKGKKIDKIILKDGQIKAEKYIFCTGGKSYPSTGSDGLGYKLAKKLGHTIVMPAPALSAIEIKEKLVKNLQGISLKNVKIKIIQAGKEKFCETGEIIFTHIGVSGPAILNISGKVENLLKNGEVKICFDLYSLLNQEEFLKKIEYIFSRYSKKTLKNTLSDFMPERLAEVLLDVGGIDKNKIANSLSKSEKLKIVKSIKNFEMIVGSVLGFDHALVTRGGVSLKEIDHKTMKSKIIDNLFFAGEIIDIDGKTGGFNLQMCWSTGYIAGKNIVIKK